MSKVKFQGLRTVYTGDPIFTVVSDRLLSSEEANSDLLVMSKPIVHATTKKVVVNEIKALKMANDREVIVINGGKSSSNGENDLTFAESDSFIDAISKLDMEAVGQPKAKPQWISDPNVAFDICRVINEGELNRLKASKAYIEKMIHALEAIQEANENARQVSIQ